MLPAAVVGRTADGVHPDRPVHRQGEVPLVLGEVGRDRVGGRDVVPRRRERQAGQVVHVVGAGQRQRGPAVLPGTPGAVLGVQDDEVEPQPG
jgi:hypothetical protein